MIKFKQTIIGTGDEQTISETEIAEKDIKTSDVIHICYHDEGKGRPCKLQKTN